MRFNHKKIFLFLLGLTLTLHAQKAFMLDRIEARVNDTLITRQDVARAMLFYPILQERGQSAFEFQRMILEELIDYKVLSLEYQAEVAVRDEDFEQVQLAVIAKLGSVNTLYLQLRKLGMTWSDFKSFISERVLYDKVMAERLETRAVVSFREIEGFYRDHYLPLQRQLGLEEKSMVEMTAQIERHLAKKKFAAGQQEWLRDLRARYLIEYLNAEE